MQLRSGRRDQDAAKDRPPTPHFVVSLAKGPEGSIPLWNIWVKSLCGDLWPTRPRFNASAANASATRSVTVDTHPDVLPVVSRTPPGSALPQDSSLNDAAAGVTTRRTTGAVQSGRMLRARLQSGRQLLSSRPTVQPAARHQRKRHAPSLLQSRRA